MLKRKISVLFLVALLSGCGLFGLEKPGSFNDRAGYAASTETTVLTQVKNDVSSGAMTSAEANQVIAIVEESHKILVEARTIMASGDIKTAEGKLKFALAILRSADAYLKDK